MTQLINVKEAARLLALSPWTIRAYVRDGLIRPVRIGRRVLFEEAELCRFVNEAKAKSKHETAMSAC